MTDPMAPEDLRRLLDEAAQGSTKAAFDTVYDKANRSRRTRMISAVAAVAVIAAAAITIPVALVQHHTNTASRPTHDVHLPAQVVHENPLKLVNVWAVRAPGAHDTTLRIGHHLEITQPCGMMSGDWSADQAGDFVGALTTGRRGCFLHGDGPNVPWLDTAASFKVYGDEVTLFDREGSQVASLTPAPYPNEAPPTWRPYPDTYIRHKVAPPAALPRGMTPATAASIVGWWRPDESPVSSNAFLQFQADGVANGSDGCNGQGGLYEVGSGGALLSVPGGTTFVLCDLSKDIDKFPLYRRAGFDPAGQLIFTDVVGTVIGRFTRVPTVTVVGTFQVDGGSAGAPDQSLTGAIQAFEVGSHGEISTTADARNGDFSLDLPAGTWSFSGTSPSFLDGGKQSTCHAANTSYRVTTAGTVRVRVVCPRR